MSAAIAPSTDVVIAGMSQHGAATIHAVRSRLTKDRFGILIPTKHDASSICGVGIVEVEPWKRWNRDLMQVDHRSKCIKCRRAFGLVLLLMLWLVCGASAADRPIVTIYTQDGCAPCRLAKKELAEARDLPFDVKFSEKLPTWVEMVPVAVWKTDEPRQFAGWHGTKRLVEVWHKTHDEVKPDEPRSPQWRTVRNKHISEHPTCIVCGKPATEVHHLRPFALFPERELDPENLRSMCGGAGSCHFKIGHLGNYKNYNPDLDYHADMLLRAKQEADKRRQTPRETP